MHPDDLSAALRTLLDSAEPDLAQDYARRMLAEAVAFIACRDGDDAAASMLRADAETVSRVVLICPEWRPVDAMVH